MSERIERKGFKLGLISGKVGLVPNDKADGIVVFFSNPNTGVEETVKVIGGEELKEGDDIYLAPPTRITTHRIQISDLSLEDQLIRYNKTHNKLGETAYLAKGRHRTIVKGIQEGDEQDVNILIKRYG